mmetsp:Transcript_6859/g.13014  ORF Transcript_6859/g.13014 Transcript_6859/m.13014 type:complete len:308 (+) Transcript_6859:1496-2419(+)
MEQRQLDTVCVAELHEALLGLVQLPHRRQAAGVLGGVRVSQHHLLLVIDVRTVPLVLVEALNGGWGLDQVILGLEERGYAECRHDTGLLLQQLHTQHVRGRRGHGDHVRPERLGPDLRDHAHRSHHLRNPRLRCEIHPGQRALGPQFRVQELQLLLLRPFCEVAEAEVLRDSLHRLGVSCGLLPDVQLHEVQAKAVQPHERVPQQPRGQLPFADLVQGVVDQCQRLQELCGVPEDGAVWHVLGTLVQSLVVGPGGDQLCAQVLEHQAVGLVVRDLVAVPHVPVLGRHVLVLDGLQVLPQCRGAFVVH